MINKSSGCEASGEDMEALIQMLKPAQAEFGAINISLSVAPRKKSMLKNKKLLKNVIQVCFCGLISIQFH